MELLNLPLEITRELLLSIDDSLTYYNLIQVNSLFLDILTEGDKEHIKKSLSTYVKERINNNIDCYYYRLPNGYKHGKYIELYKHYDTLSRKCYYVNGKKEGVERTWYTNGKKHEECYNVNDVKEGIYKEWHSNGKLYKEYNCVKGDSDGIFEIYTVDGRLEVTYNFVNNELESIHRLWNQVNGCCYDCDAAGKKCDIFKPKSAKYDKGNKENKKNIESKGIFSSLKKSYYKLIL
jgi:antitoxin component YwqK of YwqJK toxin-antitoxin module